MIWKRIIFVLLFLVTIDVALWYLIFYNMDRDMTDGLTNLTIVLLISTVNLIIGIGCFFVKRWISIPFFINSSLVIAIMNLLFRFLF